MQQIARHARRAVELGKISGKLAFTPQCQCFLEQRYGFTKVLLTTSCTDALEMAAILSEVGPSDEVIVPTFTFVSCALAFVRGGKIASPDNRPEHPSLGSGPRGSAHHAEHEGYGGRALRRVTCDMDCAMDLARTHNLLVVEDVAQAIDATQCGRPLEGLDHFGCFSFCETKNIMAAKSGRSPSTMAAQAI